MCIMSVCQQPGLTYAQYMNVPDIYTHFYFIKSRLYRLCISVLYDKFIFFHIINVGWVFFANILSTSSYDLEHDMIHILAYN